MRNDEWESQKLERCGVHQLGLLQSVGTRLVCLATEHGERRLPLAACNQCHGVLQYFNVAPGSTLEVSQS